jgi:hypothetical protein
MKLTGLFQLLIIASLLLTAAGAPTQAATAAAGARSIRLPIRVQRWIPIGQHLSERSQDL